MRDSSPDLGVPVDSAADQFARSLALPATGREVAQFVALRAAACVGAAYSNLALRTGTSLRVFHGTFLDPEIADRYNDVPLDAPYPPAAAARENRLVLLQDLEAYRQQFPEILEDTIAAGVQATASVPLHHSDGTILGVIGFVWTQPTLFDAKLQAALRAVAHLCIETVERAERYDAEHALIVELQARLLGHVPEVAGLETAARYLPASRVPTVGGDWYEGMKLGESKLAVVVGDVTGHGITSAADMVVIRGMVTALLHSGVPPADVCRASTGCRWASWFCVCCNITTIRSVTKRNTGGHDQLPPARMVGQNAEDDPQGEGTADDRRSCGEPVGAGSR